MIPDNKIKELRQELDDTIKPIFFFDDDCDGISSFLLLYRYKQEGKGVPVKAAPTVNEKFISYVKNFSPDKIFVLDTSRISEDFIDETKTKIICLDHHPHDNLDGIKSYNPRDYDPEISWPTTYWAYKVSQKEEDLWIAMVGCIGDWFMPNDLKEKFCEKYPDLMDKDIQEAHDALFGSRIGILAQIFYFVLKGNIKTVLACMKTLTRIKSPYEILDGETAAGRFIYKHYEKLRSKYDSLLNEAKKTVSNDKMVIFTYVDDRMSMTAELSNELIHLYPDKVIIVGREKDGELKCSIRSAGKLTVSKALEESLEYVEGYGGGHEHACGACIQEHDFGRFIEVFKEKLGF